MVGLRNVKTVAETPKEFYHFRKRTQSAPTYTLLPPPCGCVPAGGALIQRGGRRAWLPLRRGFWFGFFPFPRPERLFLSRM